MDEPSFRGMVTPVPMIKRPIGRRLLLLSCLIAAVAILQFLVVTQAREDGVPVLLAVKIVLLEGVGILIVLALGYMMLRSPLRSDQHREVALREAHEELQQRVLHDQMTGLPDRDFFELQVNVRSVVPESASEGMGLLQIELLRHSGIVNALGQEMGDAVTREVGRRLAADAGPDDVVGRLDGVRFGILIADVMDEEELRSIANRLCDLAAQPILHEGREARISIAAGAALTMSPAEEGHMLLPRSGIALGKALADGMYLAFYEPGLGDALARRHRVAASLREALERERITPFFQPQVCIHTGQLTGVEALVRWIDPNEGPQNPGLFLPIAQETGLMVQIDDVMRRRALRTVRDWQDRGLSVGHLGLNLTLGQLCEDGFIDRLHFDVEAVGLKPSDVAIEVLESIIVEDGNDDIVQVIRDLSDRGYYIELDDFGTGHSGLSTLRDLAVDRVKIDRSFITDIHERPELAKFTRALIRLARNLEIGVLAEGIENEHERNWLAAEGCDAIQGYMIGRPMDPQRFFDWAVAQGHVKAPSTAADQPPASTPGAGVASAGKGLPPGGPPPQSAPPPDQAAAS